MLKSHNLFWEKMKNDTGWYRPTWATLYYSKAVYDFIWRSDEDLNDPLVRHLRRKIRRFIWELSIFFVGVLLTTILLINIGLFK